MDNDSKNSEGRLGPNLPNGTRLEKIHSIQLRITCPEVSKVTDWDLKQAIKKLEPQCSNPICERIERSSQEKSIVFHLAYEDFISPKRLSEKIDLLKGHIKVHAYTLNVVVFIEETEVLKKALHNSIWLENLPTRWLELDAYQCDCIIPKDHMLRKYLEHRFGEVVQMESRSRSDNSQLHCDICVKFASEIISMEAMKMLGYDRCVVRKEGFSAVFLINASIDMYGYLSPKAIAERSSSRECFHSAQSSLSLSLTDLIAQLDEADIFLKNLKDGSELDNLDSNSLIKKEYDNLLGTCGRGRFFIESSNNRKYLLHETSQIKNKCAEIKKIGAELSGQLSILKKCVALETKNRIDQERKIEYLTVKNHAKNDIFVSNEICDLGTEVCSKNGWTDIYDLLIPRARILSTTLSQLLKIEGGGSGGLKFLNVLQKSRTVLTRYIFEIKPIIDLIKIFGNHVEIIAKIEKDLNVNFLADNADIFDVAGKDENNVKEIDFHHNQSNNSCRNGKDDDNEDNSRSSEENSEEKKEINTANNDDDEDSNKKMMKNNSEPVYRIAVDSLKKLVKLSKFNLELLFSTIRNKSLNSDDFSSNSNNSSNNNNNNNKNDNSNNDNNNNSNSHNNDDEVICIMKNKINENGDKINNEIVNSDFCEEEYLHSITRTLDTLLKITKQLKGAESIANYCRSKQQDSTTTHITSKVELQNLHNYFLTEIIYPFDYRISRISVLLRSNTEILLEPSFLQGLKNSVETACTLLERGVNAYEEDKTELEREYARIIESDRLIEKERIKKIKDDNRKLLESKISLLKSRQRELEVERDKNDKKLKADIEARRREEEMKMNEVERSEEHFARKEEKHEVGNLTSHANLSFFESKYDSRESRKRNQKRSRHQDEDVGRRRQGSGREETRKGGRRRWSRG